MSLEYHQHTAYSRESMSGGYMDWANQPWPFKRYPGTPPRELPQPELPKAAFWPLALQWPLPQRGEAKLNPARVSGLLALAAGLTAQSQGGVYLRAPASAGALYPAELYFCAQGLEGLPDGLWHYAPDQGGPRLLRAGDLSAGAAAALGGPARELSFLISGVFWKSAWKYKTRAWRYCLLDGGHLLANLELVLAAYGLGQRLCLDFAEAPAQTLLGLDPQREALVAGVAAGGEVAAGPPLEGGWVHPPEEPHSPREGRDAVIAEAATLGGLAEAREAPNWPEDEAPEEAPRLKPAPPEPGPELARTIISRRSRRNFLAEPLGPGQLTLLLNAALPAESPLGATVLLGPGGEHPVGAYVWHAGAKALERLGRVDQRRAAAAASLGQMWVGQAALNLVLWADPARLQKTAGERGYRHAMLAAGRAGQRLYLAAQALGLGCCGVGAFYDAEMAGAALLPPGAEPLYLLAAGPVKGGA
ncbi:MAG: SagB family peptide dehydrogenase [Desulfarculaceae bacterium]|nr:SagB family peptide dehydrogenase [Desulfarculaceae bacterium]